jgi:DNA processing protein
MEAVMSIDPTWLELSLYPYRIQKQVLYELRERGLDESEPFIRNCLEQIPDQPDSKLLATLVDWSEQPDQGVLSFAQLPEQLQLITNPPSVLYYRGNPELIHSRCLAVVGSRRPSPAGVENAQWFSRVIAASDVTIISGMARGIDQVAHETALKVSGQTIAVMGCGLDHPYPMKGSEVLNAIISQGLQLSEFVPNQGISRWQFPRRNRLISGLSQGVLVVEAALKSGSLVTANLAAEQGRQVFAIPGDIQNPMISGCHHLIREGGQLVSSPQEVLSALYWLDSVKQSEICATAHQADDLSMDEHNLLKLLDRTPRNLDLIRARSGFELTLVLDVLFSLELKGMIVSCADGYYKPNQGDTFQ